MTVKVPATYMDFHISVATGSTNTPTIQKGAKLEGFYVTTLNLIAVEHMGRNANKRNYA